MAYDPFVLRDWLMARFGLSYYPQVISPGVQVTPEQVARIRWVRKYFQFKGERCLEEGDPRAERQFGEAVDRFCRSCAGYAVATYVLGIGDRRVGTVRWASDQVAWVPEVAVEDFHVAEIGDYMEQVF